MNKRVVRQLAIAALFFGGAVSMLNAGVVEQITFRNNSNYDLTVRLGLLPGRVVPKKQSVVFEVLATRRFCVKYGKNIKQSFTIKPGGIALATLAAGVALGSNGNTYVVYNVDIDFDGKNLSFRCQEGTIEPAWKAAC